MSNTNAVRYTLLANSFVCGADSYDKGFVIQLPDGHPAHSKFERRRQFKAERVFMTPEQVEQYDGSAGKETSSQSEANKDPNKDPESLTFDSSLADVNAIPAKLAKILKENGYETIGDVLNSGDGESYADFTAIPGIGESSQGLIITACQDAVGENEDDEDSDDETS